MPAKIVPTSHAAGKTVYLGIAGVLHPSESLYSLVQGGSPWSNGHSRYEGVPVLLHALAAWPDAKIVLTSTLPRTETLAGVLRGLGPGLAERVSGWTFDDLTINVKKEVTMRSGGTRTVGFSRNDYWRMRKSEIVGTHVAWSRPKAWVSIDDEDILWPKEVRLARLVLTDPCAGLLEAGARERLSEVLQANFNE